LRVSLARFVVARERVELPSGTWWARVALAGGTGLLFASNDAPEIWRARQRRLHCGSCLPELKKIVNARVALD
jgi:hypothetical protein